MKVFILAGGEGTRIKSRFPDLPKALIPVHGKAFLEWQLELLIGQGFRSFVLCVGYRSEQIARHFGDGNALGAIIEYSREVSPLGTAGALKNAAIFFQQTSLVLNGDTYLAADYRALIAFHKQQALRPNQIGSIALTHVQSAARFGQVIINQEGRITEFREKSAPQDRAGYINAGAYVFEPHLLDHIPSGKAVSLENETFPDLLASGAALCGIPVKGSFVDMGTPEGYAELEEILRK